MNPSRTQFLVLLAVLAALVAIATNIIAGWGRISIHADERPLGEVIASISRQSGKQIFTTLPADTKVTLHADRALLPDVLETLAVRVDGRWEAGFALAPTRPAADALFAKWARLEREGIAQFRSRGFPLVWVSEAVFDPFKQNLSLDAAGPLQERLKAAAETTEGVFLTPENWNPPTAAAPIAGKIGQVIKWLAKSAGGSAREAILLSGGWAGGSGRDRGADGGDADRQRPQGGDGQGRGGMLGFGFFDNPAALDGMVKKAEQRIAQLPKDEQETARKDLETMRAGIAEIAALPPEQRLAKMMERVHDPAFQQRYVERMTARDFRMTPSQRLQRYERYIERKMERSGRQPGQ